MILFSIEFSGYGATIVLKLSLYALFAAPLNIYCTV